MAFRRAPQRAFSALANASSRRTPATLAAAKSLSSSSHSNRPCGPRTLRIAQSPSALQTSGFASSWDLSGAPTPNAEEEAAASSPTQRKTRGRSQTARTAIAATIEPPTRQERPHSFATLAVVVNDASVIRAHRARTKLLGDYLHSALLECPSSVPGILSMISGSQSALTRSTRGSVGAASVIEDALAAELDVETGERLYLSDADEGLGKLVHELLMGQSVTAAQAAALWSFPTEAPGLSVDDVQALLVARETASKQVDKKAAIARLVRQCGSLAELQVALRMLMRRVRYDPFRPLVRAATWTEAGQATAASAAGSVEAVAERALLANDELHEAVVNNPHWGNIVGELVAGPLEGLAKRVGVEVGRAVSPRIGQRASSVAQAMQMLGDDVGFRAEWKYDGQRLQVHWKRDGDEIELFTKRARVSKKRLERLDLTRLVREAAGPGVDECILDCEVMFHGSSFTRVLSEETQSAGLVVFDMLQHNGASIMDQPLESRLALLEGNFAYSDHFSKPKCLDSPNAEQLEEFLHDAVVFGCDGVLLKRLGPGSTYGASQDHSAWIKLKKRDVEIVKHRMHLTPIAAWYMKGLIAGNRRNEYSSVLLGVRDTDGAYLPICRVQAPPNEQMSSLSFRATAAPEVGDVPRSLKPDVWVQPTDVWQVRFAEFSNSPTYCKGVVPEWRGVSLREASFFGKSRLEEADDVTKLLQLWEDRPTGHKSRAQRLNRTNAPDAGEKDADVYKHVTV